MSARTRALSFARPLSALVLALALFACDDDEPSTSTADAQTHSDTGAAADAQPPAEDATPPTEDAAQPPVEDATPPADADLDAASPDAAPDAAPDLGPDAQVCETPPTCSDVQRVLGCRCVSLYDRVCHTDADCREGERCIPLEGEPDHHFCWYTAPPAQGCPGAEGCAHADGPLLAGAATRSITPRFETPKPAGLNGSQMNFMPQYDPEKWNDCGFDGLCPGDEGYPGPDEGEGDGIMQGAWIAGFTFGRPALYCEPEKIGCAEVDCCVSKYAHDDIEANAVVLRKGESTLALVSLDLIGYFRDDVEQIRKALPAEWGVDHLIIGSIHNHQGPDTTGQWGPGSGIPTVTGREDYVLDLITERVIEAVGEAVASLQPAEAFAGVVDTGVRGLAINDSRPPYIFDDNLPILHLKAKESGEAIATVFSYGNHAEVRWSENQHITADYFGATRKHFARGLPQVTTPDGQTKAALPGVGGVTVNFAGAVGGLINPGQGGALDWSERDDFERHSWGEMDAVGQTLAGHLLDAVHNDKLQALGDAPALRWLTQSFVSEVTNQTFQLAAFNLGLIRRGVYNVTRIGARSLPGGPNVLTEANLVRLGPLTIFTGPGEVFPETLVGGYPGRARVQNPVVGDVEERRSPAVCDAQGLHTENLGLPCIIKADQENPPNFDLAPEGPYVYERVPGEIPFYIGLGSDFLGYMVPAYDYQSGPALSQAPGSHYEETNGVSGHINEEWEQVLDHLIELDRAVEAP